MSKIKEIKEFIESNLDEDGNVIENDNFEEDIYGLIDYTNKKFNCKLNLISVGGFDSPGYDVNCYSWAGIIDGELYHDCCQQENY